jgi:hypothetical protein
MLKRLVLILVLGGVFGLHVGSQEPPLKAQKPCDSSGQQGKPSDAKNHSGFGKILSYLREKEGEARDYVSDCGQDDRTDHSLDYAKLGFLVSALVAVITIFIAIAAFIQASASKMAANAVIHSERAWVVVEIPITDRNLIIPRYQSECPVMVMCALKNKGKTPAFILEAAEGIAVIEKSEDLPKRPEYDKTRLMEWGGRGIPISPESGFARYVSCRVQDPIRIHEGSADLWVFGYVKYRDVFNRTSIFRRCIRETRYCFKYDPGVPDLGFDRQFILEGSDAYNRAT